MAKGKAHVHLLFIVVAVAHKNALAVFADAVLTGEGEVRRVILQPQGEGLRQLAAGVCITIQQGQRGFADAVAAEVHFQNRRDILSPRHLHRGAVVQHNNDIFMLCRQLCNQSVLVFRQVHMLAVHTLGFKALRQPRQHDHGIAVGGKGQCFGFQFRIGGLIGQSKTLGVPNVFAVLRQIPQRRHGVGIDMRTAAALVARLFGKSADQRDFLRFGKGQHAAILQQNGAGFGGFDGLLIIGGIVKRSRVVAVLGSPENPVQQPLHGGVQFFLGNDTVFHSLFHAAAVVLRGGRAGHFQVDSGPKALNAVLDGSPVSDHKAVKAPRFAQNFVVQQIVFRAVAAVDLIVGAHDGLRLGLFHCPLKAGKVNLVQGALVHHGVAVHAAGFLVVGGKVLHAGGHIFALHARNIGGGHLGGEVRVLGVILKVAAAQGAALNVYAGAQQHGHLFRLTFRAQGLANFLCQRTVKGGRYSGGSREADRADALVDAQVVGLVVLFAQTVGAVAHHGGGNAQPLHRGRVPEICSGQQADFFVQRHFADKLFHVCFHTAPLSEC